MPAMLDLRRLRYFLAIAEAGSLSGAARALNIAQPALSYHLAEMERILGLSLVLRGHGGARLTSEGEVLRRHAADIVRRVDSAERALAQLSKRNRSSGRLRIAIITSLAAGLTPLLVERLRQEEGGPILSITEAGTREIESRLARGVIDMAVCLAPSPGIDAAPIASEELLFVAPGGTHMPARLPVKALADYRLVLPAPGNPLRAFVDQTAREAGIALNVVLDVDGPGSRLNAVVNGIGSTLLGARAIPASAREQDLRVLPIAGGGLNRPIYLGRRKGLDPTLAARMRDVIAVTLTELGLTSLEAGLEAG